MRSKAFFQSATMAVAFFAIFAVISASAQTAKPTDLFAQTTTAQQQTASDADDDENLDASFRKFGTAAGAAYQCTPESERDKIVSDIRRAYSRIGQLFGTDRAFYFAVNVGKAIDQPFDKTKCPALLKKIRESSLVRRLSN